MAAHASDFEFLAETARRAISDLRGSVHRAPIGVGDRGSQFVAAIDALLDALENGIDERQADFIGASDDTERESLVRALQQLNHDARAVHLTTPWIESAHQSHLALGLVYFLDEMASALLKTKPDVIAAASPDYNYTTIPRPFQAELTALRRAYPAGAFPIIVHYPAQEVDSLFLHLIVAHELGHSAISEHRLVDAVGARHADKATLNRKLGEALSEIEDVEKLAAPEASVALRSCINDWVAEIVCDALALAFLGPSFLFTAAAFGTPFGGAPSASHPPHATRTKLLLQHVELWGWRDLLVQRLPTVLSWLDETGGATPDIGAPAYFTTLISALDDLGGTVREVVEGHLGASLFSLAAYEQQEDEVLALMRAKILPAQLLNRKPVDRRAALLAAWFFAFESEEDAPGALPRVVTNRDFQAFIVKALEMSAVLERWEALS